MFMFLLGLAVGSFVSSLMATVILYRERMIKNV
jgi:hypothetical protein